MDGPPHSTAGTFRIAAAAGLVVLPVGLSIDDLEPSVLLAHELVREEIPKQRLAFALCRVGDSAAEITEAVDYLKTAGHFILTGSIPERTAYRRAQDAGKTLTETPFESLNQRPDKMAHAIMNKLHNR
jgi:chromosome partitioning protein